MVINKTRTWELLMSVTCFIQSDYISLEETQDSMLLSLYY